VFVGYVKYKAKAWFKFAVVDQYRAKESLADLESLFSVQSKALDLTTSSNSLTLSNVIATTRTPIERLCVSPNTTNCLISNETMQQADCSMISAATRKALWLPDNPIKCVIHQATRTQE
jgi:hypothetical protein